MVFIGQVTDPDLTAVTQLNLAGPKQFLHEVMEWLDPPHTALLTAYIAHVGSYFPFLCSNHYRCPLFPSSHLSPRPIKNTHGLFSVVTALYHRRTTPKQAL